MGRSSKNKPVTDAMVQEFRRGCVEVNRMFWNLAQDGMMDYRDHWPKRTTSENITWVGKDKTCKRKFRRILEGIPEDWPIHEQVAYILRAFSGLQLFPDANHRTGLVVVAFVLDAQGWRFKATPTEMVRLVEEIRSEQGPFSARRTVDKLGVRDASFVRVAEFMEHHVRRLGPLERAAKFFRRAFHIQKVMEDIPLEEVQASEPAEEERKRKQGRRD